ncbi:MAG: hypothetical protein PHE09_03790 [Oscillospiraceae bacterium]|nr:hypothetical protein [Oscillospiraceae bacterium]
MPQYPLIDLADCRAECGDGGGRVEIENTEKILMLKVVLRLQSAP